MWLDISDIAIWLDGSDVAIWLIGSSYVATRQIGYMAAIWPHRYIADIDIWPHG